MPAAMFIFMPLTLALHPFASDLVLTGSEMVVLVGMLFYLVSAMKRSFRIPAVPSRAEIDGNCLQLASLIVGLVILVWTLTRGAR